ncbi:protease modulator HflC [Nitratidesulfovibrio vulgaris]|jgi:membrane protease subunit HflC|uniref:Protein HflC n=2 Tax=Nitratidesulfovibrio vulgaris TaxID=881 RepID=Q72E95_NITV2|nr:protease modulator HflC [Nitratidesulfovibrio vulgaris]GEB79939.1 protein HflC [Desulfovibrio desulfuricans]HBW16011.1 protease modulator HflC [Desulfovibrio sp.]AAS95164.1 hflC protein, putative [Nitratidesulfovibrio vulgaris str. Hildenborough]ABM29296.1 protease FtsH subunit HflC [Nitratidesulfovibrio vulgaris DP4]ADP85795.1 HflC protein [Nitratidesulfovibrio vulgaris RCH1]
MSRKSLTLLIAVLAVFIIGGQSFYTVHQTQKAIVLQLGEPVGQVSGPGLHFKLPFIQNVIFFDARMLDYDARSAEALTSDKKAIVLDNYARWRITDPLTFYRTVRTIPGAQTRLDDMVYSQLRVHVGRHTLTEVVASKRAEIMTEVTRRTSELMSEYGMEVIDVRIKRTDLPAENQRAIFGRMRAERERQAKQYRSEGQEESTKIRSLADRERAVLLAEANQKAEIIRGEGDAVATRTFANAYGQAPEFFEFMRGLETLRNSLKEGTRFVLTPDDPLLKPIRP